MSRYRPPSLPKSPLITPEGFHTLQTELDYLWRVKRPEVTRAVSEAAAQGDRSENAEYIYGKKLLREIDRRVRFLEKRLPELRVVEQKPSNQQQVYFGAWVELENLETDEMLQLRIVGCDEIDPKQHWISIESPMAKALLKKGLDEEVRVERPMGVANFLIVSIRY
ncbi:transcription elongation factor GreB [Agitococcus lubricus]|uniref:Transcription elongation factor GreB n=1 Tax=Agitococcus lubricus TaxID=1077255 RepID=A0A2T5IZK4_9GAMM|nr:transcription elongation factor GreB [Agitococcus lubricus]PTQ89511.1 transcription elongation factor GreB [Agitococcus lubricus]